ncbi:19795_t:CDS:2 [Cetraspora pellucida]|uniref:19795_t:CDS:1 n=1 Tax=Cetraspora pellucida TaxID=1433469 RepID=A0A9N9NUA0_9GLOM|nr:19795_t:CDS:2 [Cetraspora pellucida]
MNINLIESGSNNVDNDEQMMDIEPINIERKNSNDFIGQDLFSAITKVLDKYLTEPIKNMIREEISQCLFVNANLIEPNYEELNQRFIENQNDACFMTLQAIIEEVGQEEHDTSMMVQRHSPRCVKSTREYTTVPTIKKAVYKRNLYGHVWKLAQTATLLAVEQDDNEITTFFKTILEENQMNICKKACN